MLIVLYLQKLFVENFKSFYGKHVFQFEKGLNVIQGRGSKGRDLCEAIEFGLFGGLWQPHEENVGMLINDCHRDESIKKYGYSECKVEMTFFFGDELFRIDRELSHFLEDRIKENLRYTNNAKHTLTRGIFYNKIYFPEGLYQHTTFHGDDFGSSFEKKIRFLERQIKENVSSSLGMIILDNVLEGLCTRRRKALLGTLASSDLEQAILFVSLTEEDLLDLQELVPSFITLVEEMKILEIKVENFPFESSELRHELEWIYDGTYPIKGGVERLEVYGHEYTINIAQAMPNGSRFDKEKTKMIIV